MLYYAAVGMVLMRALINLSGLVMFARYADCDPMTNPARPMIDPSEVVIKYVISELPKIPGLAGLFVAAIYAAVLRYRNPLKWRITLSLVQGWSKVLFHLSRNSDKIRVSDDYTHYVATNS